LCARAGLVDRNKFSRLVKREGKGEVIEEVKRDTSGSFGKQVRAIATAIELKNIYFYLKSSIVFSHTGVGGLVVKSIVAIMLLSMGPGFDSRPTHCPFFFLILLNTFLL
jgi:hypothetical protein